MAYSRLKIAAVFLLGTCLTLAGFSQGQPRILVDQGEVKGGCGRVRALEERVRLGRKRLAVAREGYTDDHPMVQAWIEVLSRTEAALAAERAKAKAENTDCPASL